jgi:hypothetical protein
MNESRDVTRSRARSTPLIVLGGVPALGVPAMSLAVAALWSSGAFEPDPNGALLQALDATWFPALLVSPAGLVLSLWGAGLRGVLGWTAALLCGLPLLAIVFLVGHHRIGNAKSHGQAQLHADAIR